MRKYQTTCSGITAKVQQTEDFVLSLTLHGAGSEIEEHSHERPYICLLTQGGYFEKGIGTRFVSEGAVLFRRDGYEHSNRFDGRGGECFNLEILKPGELAAANQRRLPGDELESRGATGVYRLLQSFRNGAPADILNIQCHEAMAEHVWTDLGDGNPAWVQQVQERICDDPTAPVSMEALALDFQLHPNYMIRRFKQATGFTLSEYLTKKRLDHSMEGLLWGERAIIEVALDSGFYDQSHYSRNFKSCFGTTPGRYRRGFRG